MDKLQKKHEEIARKGSDSSAHAQLTEEMMAGFAEWSQKEGWFFRSFRGISGEWAKEKGGEPIVGTNYEFKLTNDLIKEYLNTL